MTHLPFAEIELAEEQTEFRVPVCFIVIDTLENKVVQTLVFSSDRRAALSGALAFAKGVGIGQKDRYKVFRASANITIGDEVQFSEAAA